MWWARSRSASRWHRVWTRSCPPPPSFPGVLLFTIRLPWAESQWQKHTESRTGVGVAYLLRFRAIVGMVRMGASFRGLWVFSWPGKINPLIGGCHLQCHIELLYLFQMSCCGWYVLCYQYEAVDRDDGLGLAQARLGYRGACPCASRRVAVTALFILQHFNPHRRLSSFR